MGTTMVEMDPEELRRAGISPMLFLPLSPLSKPTTPETQKQEPPIEEPPIEEPPIEESPIEEPPIEEPPESPIKPAIMEQDEIKEPFAMVAAQNYRFFTPPRKAKTEKLALLIATPKDNAQTPAKPAELVEPTPRAASSFRVSKRLQNDFEKDKYLTSVNTSNYHDAFRDPDARKVVSLSEKLQKSLVERFTHDNHHYTVVCFLTTARIFQFDRYQYHEVRRIPSRYIPLSPRLMTSFHHADSKFYIAYLWGNARADSEAVISKPYVEVRSFEGALLSGPHYYDDPIQQIYSDDTFIYIKTDSKVYLHQKEFFTCVQYNCDLRRLGSSSIIISWVESPNFDSYTKLPLITAFSNEILVTRHEIPGKRTIHHCFRFEDNFSIVSMDKHKDNFYVIHRNSPSDGKKLSVISKIDIGLCFPGPDNEHFFAIETTYSFKFFVSRVRVHDNRIYFLAKTPQTMKHPRYELGCIFIPRDKPLWSATPECHVDDETQFLVHDGHVVLISSDHRVDAMQVPFYKKENISCWPLCDACKLHFPNKKEIAIHKKNHHVSAFKYFSVTRNKIFRDLVERHTTNINL